MGERRIEPGTPTGCGRRYGEVWPALFPLLPLPVLLVGNGGSDGDAAQPEPRTGPAAAPAARVLIVEDEFFAAWHLSALVEQLRLSVCGIAATGAEAVAQAAGQRPDLVLMDVNLRGGIDGVEAARRIRERACVPVIFVTAYSDPATLGRIAATLGEAPVLSKPVLPDRLEAEIAAALARRAG